MKKIALLYIPVLHQGYMNFLRELYWQEDAVELVLIDGESLKEWAPTHKDIHALEVGEIADCVKLLFPDFGVKIVGAELSQNVELDWEELEETWRTGVENEEKIKLFLPDEEAMRSLVEARGWDNKYEIEWSSVFLRWEAKKAICENEVIGDVVLSKSEFDKKMIELAVLEGDKSADWWRQVGAVLVKENKVLLKKHNVHLPHEQQPNVEGDIRAQFHKGENWELGTAIHAEANLIAQAAKKGIAVEDTELYVTDFPCPNCAKLIAASGIKKVFFSKGYAVSDGERVLNSAGVEIVRVGK